jgi:hypothetical protein
VDLLGDHCCVDCAQCKECFSARLDSEETGGEDKAVEAHLASCATCRRFADKAARVTNLARMIAAAHQHHVIEPILSGPPRRPALAIVPRARQPESQLTRRPSPDFRGDDDLLHLSHGNDVRAAIESASWCGCTCCRRLVEHLSPPRRPR